MPASIKACTGIQEYITVPTVAVDSPAVGRRSMQGWFLKLTAAQQKYQANCTTGSMQHNKRYEWEQIPVFK